MALIPAGSVPVVLCDGSHANSEVAGFFLDRLRSATGNSGGSSSPAATTRWRSGRKKSGRVYRGSLIGRDDPAARLGGRQFPPGRRTIPLSVSAGMRPWLMPDGSASGCPPPQNGRRRGAGPSSSRAATATAIPGATCSTRSGPTSGPPALAGPSPSTRFPTAPHPTASSR